MKFWIQSKLESLDTLPNFVKLPLAILLLIIGITFFYIPFINGLIFLFLGARLLGKRYVGRIFRLLRIENTKRYSSHREALFHLLKK